MCGRAALTSQTLDEIAEALDAEPVAPVLYRPRYNIAPTDQVWLLTLTDGRKRLVPATWGLAPPEGRPRRPIINVRSEGLARGAFASLFREGRCAFVTSGFYEWNASRQPFFFRSASSPFLLLAAVMQPRGPDELPAMTVLTTKPNELVAPVHDRMSVVLPPDELATWLGGTPAEASRVLAPVAASALTCVRVSSHVNSVRHDDPACLAPVGDEPGAASSKTDAPRTDQLKLFG